MTHSLLFIASSHHRIINRFGYESDDGYGTKQTRQENQDSYGNLKGSYSYTDAYGLYRTVEYTAGPEGFKANIKTNEPGKKR